ncbi:flagellar export protein FliJ [Frateuria aurantia]
MKGRSERIKQLVELARRRVDHSARRLGEHHQRQQQAVNVKDELTKFRSLYGEQRNRPGLVMSAGAMWNNHQFLNRIDQALQQQETDLERQTQQAAKLRQQWLLARQRASALQLVATQLEQADMRRQWKSEQDMADEMSSQRYARSPRE